MLSLYVTVVLQGEGSAIIPIALLVHFRRAIFSSPIALLGVLRRAIFRSPRFFKRQGLRSRQPQRETEIALEKADRLTNILPTVSRFHCY